jgi:hypothetical protein
MNRRVACLTLVSLAAFFVFSACRSTVPPLSVGCNAGSTRPEAPIVCIDDLGTELSVDPEKIVAYDRDPQKQSSPMVILFFTKSGNGDFQIVPRTGNCIEQPKDHHCPPGAGMCRVHMLRRKPSDPKEETCKYDVIMKGFPPLDPFIVAKTCCGV